MFIGAFLLVRRMRLLEMGDDSACALGVSVERSRLMLMLVAVLLTAASTAIAGPISFIALVAPHIARRLSGTARWGLTGGAVRCSITAGRRSLRPAAVYALSTAGGRGDRQPRRDLPHRLARSGVTQEMTDLTTRLRGENLTLGYGKNHCPGLIRRHSGRPLHRHYRAKRLRQINIAAHAEPPDVAG